MSDQSNCNECGGPIDPNAKCCLPCYHKTFTRIARESLEPDSKENHVPKVLYTNGKDAAVFCPGCQRDHTIPIAGSGAWGYNGNAKRPTFTPSILAYETAVTPRCHSFVRDGNIQFLGDCGHKLANQTVPLPKW